MKIVQRSMFNVQRLFAVMLLVLPGVVFGEVVERIVAKVNNDIVTKTEWEDMVEARMAGKKPQPFLTTPPPQMPGRPPQPLRRTLPLARSLST